MNKKKTVLFGAILSVFLSFSIHADMLDTKTAYEAWIAIAQAEKTYNIPKGLLHSMSLVETGKGLQGRVMPWPYTISVNSPAKRTYTSTEDALKRLYDLNQIGFQFYEVTFDGRTYKNMKFKTVENLIVNSGAQIIALDADHFGKRFATKAEAADFANRILALGYTNMDIGLMQINWHYHGKHFVNIEAALDQKTNLAYAVSYLNEHRQTSGWWESVGRYHSKTDKYAKRYIKNVYAMYRRVHRLQPQA